MKEQKKYIEEPDASLLLSYIGEKASAEECSIVENWLHDKEENEQILLQMASIYHVQYTHGRIEKRDSLKAFGLVQERIRQRVWRKNMYRFSSVAACIAVGFFLSTILSWWNVTNRETNVQMVTIRSNPGMRTSCNLPDGTVAYLNSGSTLIYPLPYDKDRRTVTLKGEAYFKVVHDPAKPFIVSVSKDRMRVKVLGTEFNVQSYEDEDVVQTTLVSGSVDIEMIKNGNLITKANLRPSEKAVYDIISGSVSITTVNTDYDTAWRNGCLMFKDMPLPQVLKKLAYFYNVKFEVEDPVINSYRFTGTFQNKQLSQVLDYLKISSHMDYMIKHIVSDDSQKVQCATVILRKK